MEKVTKFSDFEKLLEKVTAEDMLALHNQVKSAIDTLEDAVDEISKYKEANQVGQKNAKKAKANLEKAVALLKESLVDIKKLDK